MSESRAAPACSDGGKPKSFCVPCARKKSPLIIRKTDNSRGAHDARFVVMLVAPRFGWPRADASRTISLVVPSLEARRSHADLVWAAASVCRAGSIQGRQEP